MCERLDSGEKREDISRRTRYSIYSRDKLECIYCGRECIPGIHHKISTLAATLEHWHVWSKGGIDTPKNLFCCCAHCNFSKRDLSAKAFCEREGFDYEEVKRERRRRQQRKINYIKGRSLYKAVQRAKKDNASYGR